MAKHIIRNIVTIAAFIVIVYLLATFFIGVASYERIQGEWVCVITNDTYVFDGRMYIFNGVAEGTFKIQGNRILFCNGREYSLAIRRSHIAIDGRHFLKRQ